MMRPVTTLAIALGWALAAGGAPAAPLTSLQAIHALSHDEATREPSVAFEATVSYRREHETTLFVQDQSEGIYVWASEDFKLVPGDRVLIEGKAQDSFRPIVVARTVTLLHRGTLPTPVPATFDELIHSKFDSTLVSIRAQVLSTDLVRGGDSLVLLADGGTIETYVDSGDVTVLKGLLDAEVEITGVASAQFDGKMQQTGVQLSIPSFANIKVIEYAGQNPWSSPVTRMDEIISQYHVKNLSRRVRIHGTITYYQPGSHLVLQNGARSLWIMTKVESPLRIGYEADVTGFPDVHDGFLTLADGEVREMPVYGPIAPQPATAEELSSSKHLFDLVLIEGKVVMEVRENSQDEYVLVSDGEIFSAIYRHPNVYGMQPMPMNEVPVGSTVRVSGISAPLSNSNSNPFRGGVPFNILMRSPDDISVIAQPSLINTRNLLLVLGALVIVVFIVVVRGWVLERKVRRQTAVMSARIEVEADLERQRSRILEDINESRPLAEILVEIAAMVSSKLGGAPCWCEVADGERLGDFPNEQGNLRVVRASIDGRIGPALGALFAGLHPDSPLIDRETVALQNGARLATLAIETRRLYSDLRRRSEYDLLTDIPNRFAFEKFIELQIDEARQSGRLLGLIYIDLDKFKLINDTYGHHVGDLYLQEAALRMSHQLLGRDMLARLGGDEFAALVSLHHGLADLDKIVARLNHCFVRPFNVGGFVLNGAASIGVALYPQEGAIKDSLLSAADAAMYLVKNRKREVRK